MFANNIFENVEILKNLLEKKDVKKCREFLLNVESSFLSYRDRNKDAWDFAKMILDIDERNQQNSTGYGCFTFIYRDKIDSTIAGYKDASDIFEEMEEENQFVFDVFIPKKELTDFRLNQMLMYSNLVGMDCYICTAELFKGNRRTESLKCTNVIVLDLDIYNTNKYGSYSEYPDIMDEELLNELLPVFKKIKHYPNYYLNSGRGRYLVFQLEKSVNLQNEKMLKLLSGIKKKLVSEFSDFGADAKCVDAGRLIHMVGSINSKTKMGYDLDLARTNLYHPIYLDECHNLAEFMYIKCSNVGYWENHCLTNISNLASSLGIKKNTNSNKKQTTFVAKKQKFSSKYSKVNNQRLEDFQKLMVLRDYDLSGSRNYFFEFMANTLFFTGYSESEVWNYIVDSNDSLKTPLKESQLLSIFRYNVNNFAKFETDTTKAVKYTNRHIVKLLGITEEEQKEMQQLIDDNEAELREKTRIKELAKQRKIERQNNKAQHQKEKEEKSQSEKAEKLIQKEANIKKLKETILQMTESGLTAQEIADKLGISRRKVFYYKKL